MTTYWDYPFHPAIKKQYQLDLGQGNTPMSKAPVKIQQFTGIKNLYLKREDLNPNGSFKDRALGYQMSYLLQKQAKYCVLSSSGNAAISCCAFAQKTDIKSIILVSPDISENKLSQIVNRKPYLLIKSKNARRLANYINKKYNIPILNPSKDLNASMGFETLGMEIYKQNPKCDAIFSYSTSGASLLGIFQYYLKNNINPPRLIGVKTYTTKISRYQSTSLPRFYSFPNKQQIIQAISQTNGSLYQIHQDEIKHGQQILHDIGISSSQEGSACLHAVKGYIESAKELNEPKKIPSNIVLIISGTEHKTLPIDPKFPIHSLEAKEEIDKLL